MTGQTPTATFDLRARRPLALPRTRVVALSPHARGLGIIALLAIWLMRRFLFTSALPAGTDMLGFIARAHQNASFGAATSMWSPSVWGAVRQVSLENILGLATIITGDPVVTVKAFAFGTLFAAGAFAYLLAWRFYRSVGVATFAGIAFMTSQASLSRWASGQLNVELALAAAPLLILLWVECVEAYAWWRALRFALVVALVMLVRPDMVLYVAPFLVLHVVLELALARRAGIVLASVAKTCSVVLAANIALGAYTLVPVVRGVKATWLSSGGLFRVDDFVQRSLDAYPSLLGFGRELGYLGFTGQQTWFSHPWLALWLYEACASVLVALALGAVWWRRDPRTLFLAGSAILAAFMAKGVRAPLGSPYLFAVNHLPVFGNLRGPNRWLIVGSLAYALLAGLTLRELGLRVLPRFAGDDWRLRAVGPLVTALLVLALFVPVGPTLLTGFRTWEPKQAQLGLLRAVERDPGRFEVATIPFDQGSRFVRAGSYRGFEHDLGAESAAYTGHPALADGGWNQKASDDVAFTSTLLEQRDPAFARLLGTTGVKYLVKFEFPEVAPHLLPPNLVTRAGKIPAAMYQQRAVETMSGLQPVLGNAAGTVYRLPTWSPAVTFRPNLAVVLGGRSGLAALADLPGLHVGAWAAVTADDAVQVGGFARLLSLVRSADLVVVSDEEPKDVAILAAPPVASLAGLSSDPGLDRLTELLPSDESTRTGALADQSIAPADVGRRERATTFTLPKARPLELWCRVESTPTAALLTFRLDGRIVAQALPLAPLQGGFRWVRLATLQLAAGTHTLEAGAQRSMYGDSFEIDEAKLVAPSVRQDAMARLTTALRSTHAQRVYSLAVDALQARAPETTGSPEDVTNDIASFWGVLDRQHTIGKAIHGSYGTALGLILHPGRAFYTVVEHRFARPLDWRARRYLYLTYKGTVSGATYRFFLDFGRQRVHSASWSFTDDSRSWKRVAFSTRTPERGLPPLTWRHVVSVRIATDSKNQVGVLELGRLSLSPLEPTVAFRYALPASRGPRVAALGGRSARVTGSATQLRLRIREDALGQGYRVVVRPRGPIRERPAEPVRFVRTGETTYRYSVDTRSRGVLVLGQAYDRLWTAADSGVRMKPVPVFAAINGYLLGEGRHTGTISFGGQTSGHEGMLISAFSLLVLVPLAGAGPRLRRWKNRPPVRST